MVDSARQLRQKQSSDKSLEKNTMKQTLLFVAAFALATGAKAQLWNGDPLPPAWGGDYVIDPYFVPDGGGQSEFDMDSGFDFSLDDDGTRPIGITEDNGWLDASTFALSLEENDVVKVTFLGETAGWNNDFGMNLGNSNVSGGTAFTIWDQINGATPSYGSQTGFTQGAGDPSTIDFWLNSNNAENGGTYSMFFPDSSDPSNSGLPAFDYSARGRVFDVFDDIAGIERSILVIAIEDWRNFDADFTDMFFAIEIGTRFGEPQFPVPEPSTYGLLGAMVLLGLVAVRRARRS
jgi:hypothetical protein